MGERKGTNKYYPPDYDPKKGGLNKFMGTHPLRERARKLHLGILIIRFEMPYNIWCDGCGNHIGMGVRYNAEKTKVGMYYSTPVYQFRMKCHLCDSHFEMKTDPGNLDYVIVSGARRQENRWNPEENGQVVPDDKRVIRQLADDAMFKLQHGVEDKTKLSSVAPTLGALEELQERWKDDYSANKSLRDMFRTKKKEIKAAEEKDKEFLAKRSLDIPLLQETDEDAKIASLIRLQPSQSSEERQLQKRKEIDSRSKFPLVVQKDTKDAILSTSVSSSKQYKNNSFSHLNINTQTLAKQRSSLGISLSKKASATSSSSLESKVHIKEEPEEPIISMEVDFESSETEHSSEPMNSCRQSTGNDVPQHPRSRNNLSPEDRCTNESGGTCSRSHSNGNTETVTTESQPKVIISSALQVQSGSGSDGGVRVNEEGEKDEHKIRDSSTRSSAPERQLPSHPSTSNSKVPCGLSLVSCDYGSSSSGNEDD